MIIYRVVETGFRTRRHIALFTDKEEAQGFCDACNTPSHVSYTGTSLSVISEEVYRTKSAAIEAANERKIQL